MAKKKLQSPPDEWLAENHPALHHTLHALDGDRKAQRWLEKNAIGLFHICRALTGQEEATADLESLDPAELGLLIEIMDDDVLLARLQGRHSEIHDLFLAGRGHRAAKRRIGGSKKATSRKLAEVLARLHESVTDGSRLQVLELTTGSAADVGQLVGEMHLKKGEYAKAVEAFTRALEGEPTADAYHGRAEAYLGLARQDNDEAVRLRKSRASSTRG